MIDLYCAIGYTILAVVYYLFQDYRGAFISAYAIIGCAVGYLCYQETERKIAIDEMNAESQMAVSILCGIIYPLTIVFHIIILVAVMIGSLADFIHGSFSRVCSFFKGKTK